MIKTISNILTKNINLQHYLFVISLWITALFVSGFWETPDFKLEIPDGLFFSEAVSQGIDVGKRVSFFYKIVFFSLILLTIVYFITNIFTHVFGFVKKQLENLAGISLFGLCLLCTDIIGIDTTIATDIFLGLFIVKFLFYLIGNFSKYDFRILRYEMISHISLSVGFLLGLSILFIFNKSEFIQGHFPLVFGVLSVTTSSLLIYFHKKSKWTYRRILFLLLPFAALPMLLFLTLEVVMYVQLKYEILLRYKVIYLMVFLSFLLTISILAYFRKNYTITGKKAFLFCFGPAVLIGTALFYYYSPFIIQTTETFEIANPINSMLRVFKFGQLPFVDFMSSHMLYEQWYGYLYIHIFGYTGSIDFMAYEFLNNIIFLLTLWIFLNKLFNIPTFSLLYILAFPFLNTVFFSPIFLTVILFFFMLKLLEKQNTFRYFLFFSSVCVLFIWRLDTGSAAILTAFIFFPLVVMCKQLKLKFKPFIKGLALSLLLPLFFLGVAFVLRSPEYVINNMKAALHYISAQQAHGFSVLSHLKTQQFYIYHVFLPFFGLIALCIALYKLYKLNNDHISFKTERFLLLSSVFFFIIYFANFQRGLVRHSFVENTELYLVSLYFLASALFILHFFSKKTPGQLTMIFLPLTFVLYLFLKFFPISETHSFLDKVITENALIHLDSTLHENKFKGRVIKDDAFNENTFTDLKAFFDKNLTPKQTFLDFSNTPALYFYCGRYIPGYFNQNLQNIVTDFLQIDLLKSLSPEKTPLVIYSNYPPGWFDATDGIPNSMRYYVLAEYVYKNYEPLCVVNNKSIWSVKDRKFIHSGYEKDSLIFKPQNFYYNKTAFYTAQFYERAGYQDLSHLKKLIPETSSTDEHLYFLLNNETDCTTHCYLEIELSGNSVDETISVHLRDTSDNYCGHFTFETVAHDNQKYMLRLSNNYHWHQQKINKLIIDKRKETHIINISLYKDLRFEDPS
ncbi:MAG: hypothetical protein PHT69_10290 [Bacteroidales bacterium]|nr:hypothetical protein [Bacteroidales bacterium]